MANKIRVYELAKELGKDNKSLEETIKGLGIQIKNYMSTITIDEADRVRQRLGGSTSSAKPSSAPATKSGTKSERTVIRRRASEVRRRREAEAEEEAEEAEVVAAPVTETTRPAPMRPVVRPRPPMSRPAATPAPTPATARPPHAPSHTETAAPTSSPAARARPPVAPAAPPTAASPATDRGPAMRPGGDGRPSGEPPRRTREREEGMLEGNGEGDAEKREPPKVGERIELPKGSRRLPGGMAARLETKPGQPAMAAEAGPGQAPAVSSEPGRVPAPPPAELDGRRVVRNEDGVIVGARSQRSEPKILGFIPLAPSRKRQTVIITDASEEDRRGRATQRKAREERAQAQGRRRKMTRKGGRGAGGAPAKVSTIEMSEDKKRIRVDEAIQVSDLAHQMGVKASVVLRQLWGMGLRGITINNAIDAETAEMITTEFGYSVENVSFQETEIIEAAPSGSGDLRAPVVTMMGHVDHGKTSLLDKLREARVAAGEAGGITQHIGAYKVDTAKGPVVFLDTPGHEAFSAMRSRGAQITDIVVLVVAADDGVMPTTVEAIKHAKEARVALVVAINKMDKPDANPGRVKQALMEQGVVGEEFGGDIPIVEVSAKSGVGLDDLLETLALQAEVLELRSPLEGRAQGVVLEARIDKGRGTIATVLVQSGLLKLGDIVVANEYQGKVRGLFDDVGKQLKEVGPSTPVEVLGLPGVPAAGDLVNVVESDRDAKALVSHRRELRKRKESVRTGPTIAELLQRKKTPVLKIVLKADVQGSAQALTQALEELSTEKVKVEVIKSEVGQINETDVKYARAGDAVIFGFNVKTTGKAAPVADAEKVPIYTYSVIYAATEEAQKIMIGMLEPEYRQKEQGEAEVRALFPIPRLGVVAGCRVLKGLIQRSSHVRVVRAGKTLFEGTIGSLRVFKDDVREVREGFECGIVVDGFPQVQEGDLIQAFEVEAIPPTL
jgi:translation initiation factor IF-2